MKQVYISVDIGSDTIKVVACELFNNKLNLLAASSIKSEGIKKGLITDVEKASESLKNAIKKVEEMLGIKISKVITSLPSYYAQFEMVKGKIELNKEEIITGKEVVTLLQNAMKTSKNKELEMVTVIPVSFSLDDVDGIKDPKGMQGNVLSTRAIMVLVPKKNILSVVNLLENVGLEVVDVSLNCIGDMYATKDKDLKEKIGAVINIGHETTTISLYNKGIVVKSTIIGMGGKNIDNDIAYIYKLTNEDANRIKEKFALAHKKYASVNDIYEINNKNDEKIKINQYEVSEIVMARLEEILVLARKEINLLTKHDVDYILITGGTSNMSNFSMIAEEVLGKKTKIGEIRLVGLRHNKFSSAVGNIVYFIGKLKLKGKKYSMISKDDMNTLLSAKKNLISSDTMLGKVFGYFFSE
ncbi:MAG: cell division protein FtsA [Bacilli bacterium]|nr:cell division protein FtsA [Bacilli bacterium]